MSAPNVAVGVEPSDGQSIFYEPVAPENANDKSAGIVCLLLSITNKESKQIHLNEVTLGFSSQPPVSTATITVPTNWWPPSGTGVNIAPGAKASWNFLREGGENDAVVLPSSARASVTLSLFFDGFTSPWTVTKKLAPHTNPVVGGAYLFPAQFDDLRAGEFWGAASNVHATGSSGSQLFAYDMNVVAWDNKTKSLNRLLPGKNGGHNEDYRVWGKKLHAMANGTVLQFVNDCPNNSPPLATQFNGNKAHDDQLWTTQKNAFWGPYDAAHGGEGVAHAGAGNHFYIQHGSEVALYAHMQKGSLNTDLLAVGATVKAGQFLGLAGNAGNASEPHLHIHTIKGSKPETGPLRPLLFREMFAIAAAALSLPAIAGPWTRVKQQGPPLGPANALVWPLGRNPQWRGWHDLGGPISSSPAVASWSANRLDVFAAGSNGHLSHKRWDGSVWHNWEDIGGTFKEGPAAVSWGPNRIDIFVRGMDDHLGHRWWDGTGWKGWQDLGGPISSAPAVASWGPNRLDVFAAGANGQLSHLCWDGSKWHPWENLGGTFKGAPAAVSRAPNRIAIFVRGMDDHIGHRWWNGNSWQGWTDLGSPVESPLAAASWSSTRLDLFLAGADNQMTHKWWDGSSWSDWDWIGGYFKGSPAAVSWGPNRIDVLVRGTDDHLGHLSWS